MALLGIIRRWHIRDQVPLTAKGFAQIALDTPLPALAPHVATIVDPLFASFNGAEVSLNLIEECVQQLIERKIPG